MNTVTGPSILSVSVESLMERGFRDVGITDKFVVQLRDVSTDIVDSPDTALEGFESAEDVEVKRDPRAACIPSKFKNIRRGHRDFMLVTD